MKYVMHNIGNQYGLIDSREYEKVKREELECIWTVEEKSDSIWESINVHYRKKIVKDEYQNLENDT